MHSKVDAVLFALVLLVGLASSLLTTITKRALFVAFCAVLATTCLAIYVTISPWLLELLSTLEIRP